MQWLVQNHSPLRVIDDLLLESSISTETFAAN